MIGHNFTIEICSGYSQLLLTGTKVVFLLSGMVRDQVSLGRFGTFERA